MPGIRLGVCLALCCLATGLEAQQRDSRGTAPGWEEFVRAFDEYAAQDGIVGNGAVLVRNGRVVRRHSRGMADRELGQPADENTIYHWASITKTLTAVAIMQLRDRGRLSLDDRLTSWIPELRQIHAGEGSMDQITLRMLLSHSSGLQDPTWPYGRGRSWEPFEPTRWEQLVAMMPYQELRFRPGSRFGYSNPAFIYLARVIEAITGDPYQSYIQKNIWTPLGMTRSYFGATPYHLAEGRSNNYTIRRDSAGREAVVAGGRDFDPGITIPNGGWNAPLGDVALWAAFLVRPAATDSAVALRFDRVLARASIDEMWRPVVPMSPGSTEEAMGLSFYLYGRGERAFVGHTGDQAGFRSFMLLDPRTHTAVISVVNTSNSARSRESDAGFQSVLRSALRFLAGPTVAGRRE